MLTLVLLSVLGTTTPGTPPAYVPVPGAAQEITCTAAASDVSTVLQLPGVYMVRCDSDAYVRWCTAAAGCTAVAGDFKLPMDTILRFGTSGPSGVAYFAAKNVAVNGSCWLLEVQ